MFPLQRACRATYSHPDPTWRVTSAFSLYDLVLVAITNNDGHEGIFQAQIDIVHRR